LSSVSVGVALLLDEGQQQRLDRRAGRFGQGLHRGQARRGVGAGEAGLGVELGQDRLDLAVGLGLHGLVEEGSSARRRPCRRAALGCGEALGAVGREQAQRRQGAIHLLRRRC
jgi:hypothetical protein